MASVMREIILEAVQKKGTQHVLAEEVGVDGAAISRFMSGEGTLKMETIEKIMAAASARVISAAKYQRLKDAIRLGYELWEEDAR